MVCIASALDDQTKIVGFGRMDSKRSSSRQSLAVDVSQHLSASMNHERDEQEYRHPMLSGGLEQSDSGFSNNSNSIIYTESCESSREVVQEQLCLEKKFSFENHHLLASLKASS